MSDADLFKEMGGNQPSPPSTRRLRRPRHTVATDPLPLLSFGKRFYVYVYRDTRPSKKRVPIYVGKGTGNRADKHWINGVPHNALFDRILRKIKAAKLEPIAEIVASFDNEKEAFEYERELIKQYGRRNIGTGSLCNLTDGGEGPSGCIPTLETRARMSKAAKGKIRTPEHCANLSAAKTGKRIAPHTLEWRAKMSEIQRGRKQPPRSDDFRAKMSAAKKGQKHTPEARAKMSATRTGRPSPKTPEHRAKISATLKGRKLPPERLAKLLAAAAIANAGRRHTPEARAKMSLAHGGNPEIHQHINKIAAEYEEGASQRTIAARYGVGRPTIRKLLTQAGVVMRHAGRMFSAETRAKISVFPPTKRR